MDLRSLQKRKWKRGSHIVIEERGGTVEAIHHVHAAVVDRSGALIASSGDPDFVTFTRSSLKPIQAIPILKNGAHTAFGFNRAEIALISGSHSGEPEHISTVRSILKKAGLDESMLRCGGHEPFHKSSNFAIGGKFTSIHDNCSGKHAGSLALTKHMGWDLTTYLKPEHPAQQAVKNAACELGDMPPASVLVAPDGCSIPNLAYPIRNLALQFARLGDPKGLPLEKECKLIRDSMMENPYMVAGTDRFDKDLMEDRPMKIVSKGGAVGLQALAFEKDGEWLGLAVKVEDGSHLAMTSAVYTILGELGMDPGSGKIDRYRVQSVDTRAKEPVGSVRTFGRLAND
jgi:L-asparaginase II